MEREPYQPTPEEQQKAEEMMRAEQKATSDIRAEHSKEREKAGIEIPPDLKAYVYDYDPTRKDNFLSWNENTIAGTFKNHKVELKCHTEADYNKYNEWKRARGDYGHLGNTKEEYMRENHKFENRRYNFEGTIDGKPLSTKEAEKLWNAIFPAIQETEKGEEEIDKKLRLMKEQKEAEEKARKIQEQRQGIEESLKDFGI